MINILLSTYNGELYIRDLLDSIISQTFQKWTLLIRDDGSTDSTLNILAQYINLYPDKIALTRDELGNVGPGRSFMQLLGGSKAEYYMYCDQDDVWFPDKIEKCMEQINLKDKKGPILLCTDLRIVDSQLNPISGSLWDKMGFNPDKSSSIYEKLTENSPAYGCTMFFNDELKNKLFPYCEKFLHDHWTYLLASYYGNVFFLKEATIDYRQHQANVIGAYKIRFTIAHFFRIIIHCNRIIRNKYIKYKALPFEINAFKWIFYSIKHHVKEFKLR